MIAALAAIRAEPLRESAHGALIKVFLAEGNQMEALEGFNRYRDDADDPSSASNRRRS